MINYHSTDFFKEKHTKNFHRRGKNVEFLFVVRQSILEKATTMESLLWRSIPGLILIHLFPLLFLLTFFLLRLFFSHIYLYIFRHQEPSRKKPILNFYSITLLCRWGFNVLLIFFCSFFGWWSKSKDYRIFRLSRNHKPKTYFFYCYCYYSFWCSSFFRESLFCYWGWKALRAIRIHSPN